MSGLILSWDERVSMAKFRPIDRQTGLLLPPSVDEWLLERHLARFVVGVIDGLASFATQFFETEVRDEPILQPDPKPRR